MNEFGYLHRLPSSNKVDFEKVSRRYKLEHSKPYSVVLDELADTGQQATEACRAMFRLAARPRSGDTSSFGAVKMTSRMRVQRETQDEQLTI